ncbi:hypothetical protein HPB51_005727 [Rhipicephalus microplus]|uniref:Uncharacterized protein n=1 Tax=Rhipicephalus microplus TaxID=6941 RepID=A0A9J6EXZ8_RHIMP|nr:hypothetical protein HPB51_005727 [Rhipicephalus microplus]
MVSPVAPPKLLQGSSARPNACHSNWHLQATESKPPPYAMQVVSLLAQELDHFALRATGSLYSTLSSTVASELPEFRRFQDHAVHWVETVNGLGTRFAWPDYRKCMPCLSRDLTCVPAGLLWSFRHNADVIKHSTRATWDNATTTISLAERTPSWCDTSHVTSGGSFWRTSDIWHIGGTA